MLITLVFFFQLYSLDLQKLDSPLMDVQFTTSGSLLVLCASREHAFFECTLKAKGKNKKNCFLVEEFASGKSTNELLRLSKRDYVQCFQTSQWGICLVSACGAVRLLVPYGEVRPLNFPFNMD